MEIFIVRDNQQLGPFTIEQLRGMNISGDTLVWHQGMADWAKASTVQILQPLFAPAPQPVYQQPVQQPYQQPVYQQPVQQPVYQQPVQQPVYQQPVQQPVYQQPVQQPVYQQPVQQPVYQQPYQQSIQNPHSSYATIAWICIVAGFCCSCIGGVFGILALVNANKANAFYHEGDEISGESSNSTARTYLIISAILIVLGCGAGILNAFVQGLLG